VSLTSHALHYFNLIYDLYMKNKIGSDYYLCSRHHQHGRWQARIGRVAGNKDLYLGTFSEYTLTFFGYSLFCDCEQYI